MYCRRCGRQLKDGSNFCQYCGARAGGSVAPEEPVRWNACNREGGLQPQSLYYSQTGENQDFSLISLICGILGTVFFWLVVPGFILGTVALIFGWIAQLRKQNKKGRAVAGIVLGIAALALSIWIIAAAVGDTGWYPNNTQMELNYI